MAPASSLGAQVAFCVRAETSFGESVFVVGAAKALGAWKPGAGLALLTGPGSYPHWSGTVQLPDADWHCLGGSVEFKFVILRQDGSTSWEPGPNRRLLAQQAKPLLGGAAVPERLKQLPTLRFGEPASDELFVALPSSLPELSSSNGVHRMDSSASTCCLLDFEEDALSTTVSSRCASWTCLPQEDSPDSPCLAPLETMEEAFAGSLALWASAHRTPKPEGRCEDSFFFSSFGAGVADGVGQMADYAEHGIDAAAYAAELMELSAGALAREVPGSPSERAVGAMAAAEAEATSFGASTITVLAVDGNSAGVANLGDSGYLHLRSKAWGMEIIDRSREQNHGWNCPYQLTKVPEALASGCGARFDSSTDCHRYQLGVQAGDLVLLFTDGLTDNLHWYEIAKIVNDVVGSEPERGCPDRRAPPESIARTLVLAAQERSQDASASTPFERIARRHRIECPGGKTDDITVVAAWVLPDSDEHVASQASVMGLPHRAGDSRELKFGA